MNPTAQQYFQRQTQITQSGYGANDIAVFPAFTFPLFNFFGTGILPTFHWGITQQPPAWANPVLRVIGNPGIVNGSMIGQPPIDTRGLTGAG